MGAYIKGTPFDVGIANNRDDTIGYLTFIPQKTDIRTVVEEFYPGRTSDPTRKGYAMGRTSLPPVDILGYETSKRMFASILRTIFDHVGAFTIVYESYNVNPVYRDSYYSFFAGQHFDVSRFAERCLFFKGDLTEYEDFYTEKQKKDLQEAFVGTCIIYPTEAQTIGRVLFKPEYIIKSDYPVHLRLTEYSVSALGVHCKLRAFPHMMQDRETTRCAEVTLLNMLDYYANCFTEYKTLLPGEVVQLEKQFTMERTLPSRGTNYAIMSKILIRCGFSPRLYSREALKKDMWMKPDAQWQGEEMRRIMHYYIESGIPVALNVGDDNPPGHSLICIGYQDKIETVVSGETITDKLCLYNAADFYRNYVVIDDNQMPYAIKKYECLSLFVNYQVENMLVPLYKRMHLEAADAYDMARHILSHESFGIAKRYKSFMKKKQDVVIRLFLASSRKYKKIRIENSAVQCAEYRDLIALFGLQSYLPMRNMSSQMDWHLANMFLMRQHRSRMMLRV